MTGFNFGDLPLRAKASYIAHAFKAAFKQHHTWMNPIFAPMLDDESVIFDIGGHSGQYAKLLARLAKRGRVYSFEPSSYSRSILNLAIKVNRFKNINVVAKGLGDAPGTLTLTTPIKSYGTFKYGLAHMGDGTNNDAGHHEQVALTTIDAFATEVGLKRLDFIKMDVEGWELRILSGGAETIQRFRPVMMIELVGSQLARAGDSLEEAWALLQSWGYHQEVFIDAQTLRPSETPLEGDGFWLPD
ncbi:MAG: FkbM family methyltransferase [Proteobacteria bacterium]|nr:FkbM family methyltransferase [Pseudomonadota bacterium]